jgi:hypothetical protein
MVFPGFSGYVILNTGCSCLIFGTGASFKKTCFKKKKRYNSACRGKASTVKKDCLNSEKVYSLLMFF